MVFMAGIPVRVGYGAEGRGLLLTKAADYTRERQKHLVLEYLDLLAAAFGHRPKAVEKIALEAPPTKEGKRGAGLLLKSVKARPATGLVALGPGATFGPAKRWPAGHWRTLIAGLLDSRREHLLVLGGAEEEPHLRGLLEGFPPDRVHLLAGRTPLPVLVELLRMCRLFVTNDTGPMHAAAAVGTPVVALFGSTSPLWTRPWGKGHRVLRHPVPCSPCFQRKCNIGYPCLKDLAPDAVIRETLAALKRKVRVVGEAYSVDAQQTQCHEAARISSSGRPG
jgi:heptosyltransferase-2